MIEKQINELANLFHPGHNPASFTINFNVSSGWTIRFNWRTFPCIEIKGKTFDECVAEIQKKTEQSLHTQFVEEIKQHKNRPHISTKNNSTSFTCSFEEEEMNY